MPVPTGDVPGREAGMVEAIMNLLLIGLGVLATFLWIIALVDSDGRCHEEDCTGCPYGYDCQERRKLL